MYLKESGYEGMLDSFGAKQGHVVGSCEHSNEPSDSKKHCQHLKKASAPWI
jgi:hypothetical protein